MRLDVQDDAGAAAHRIFGPDGVFDPVRASEHLLEAAVGGVVFEGGHGGSSRKRFSSGRPVAQQGRRTQNAFHREPDRRQQQKKPEQQTERNPDQEDRGRPQDGADRSWRRAFQ